MTDAQDDEAGNGKELIETLRDIFQTQAQYFREQTEAVRETAREEGEATLELTRELEDRVTAGGQRIGELLTRLQRAAGDLDSVRLDTARAYAISVLQMGLLELLVGATLGDATDRKKISEYADRMLELSKKHKDKDTERLFKEIKEVIQKHEKSV